MMQNMPMTVTVYHRTYYRPPSNFNPTLLTDSVVDLLSQPYNFNIWIQAGLLPKAASNSAKRKFIVYNSNLTVLYLRFLEVTFSDATENALFFTYFGAYKWMTAYGCVFELRQQLVMT
jgi:hypothetical protein